MECTVAFSRRTLSASKYSGLNWCSRFHQLSRTEGAPQTNCNDEDATEDHHEITDAKQSQLSLVR